jgi:hypothetical protein
MSSVETPAQDAADRAAVDRHELPLRLWARAHHEAAHAVVGTLLGARVTDVEIWSGPPVGGRVRLTGLDDPTAGPHGLVRRIVYQLAGPLAEQIASGESGTILNGPASLAAAALMAGTRDPEAIDPETDLGTVAGLILDHFGPDDEAGAAAAVDHLPLHVETLVRDQWGAVQQVAASLLRYGRLTEDQVQSIASATMVLPESGELLQALPEAP